MIRKNVSSLIYPLTYLKIPNHVGLPNARNIGIENSNYPIIGFLDDDCLPIRNDLLKRAYKWFHTKNQKIIGVGGPVFIRTNKPELLISRIKNYKSIFRNRNILKLIIEFLETRFYKINKLHFTNALQGGNCFFRKEYLNLCGRFDPKFDGNHIREESDVCMGLRKFGFLVFDPKMPVNHLKVNYSGCRVKLEWYFSYVLSNTIYLIRKHNKISIEVFIDTFLCMMSCLKLFITGRENNYNYIKRYSLIKSMIIGFLNGIKKYHSPIMQLNSSFIDKKASFSTFSKEY